MSRLAILINLLSAAGRSKAFYASFSWLSLWSLLSGCVFVSGEFSPFTQRIKPLEEKVIAGEGDAKILLLDISRVISTEEEAGAFGIEKRQSVVARLEEELRRAGEDKDVKALVVRINSPGGTVTASDIVYEQLRRFRKERDVPLTVHLMDQATSGGYYAALAADQIVAHPTTITGSIGVVFYTVSLEGLLGKIGVRNETVKTGDKKDIGSPLRTMTDEEREILQGVLDELQERFLAAVRERRPGLTKEAEKLISDGRLLTASQALELRLIDRIGYLENTVELTKQQAGLRNAKVIVYHRPDEYAENIYSNLSAAAPHWGLFNIAIDSLFQGPQFLYLWLPGQ